MKDWLTFCRRATGISAADWKIVVCFIEQARREEREACAKIADEVPGADPYMVDTGAMWRKITAQAIAAAIRARRSEPVEGDAP